VPIYRNKPLYVIGGGDSAAEEATFLTKYASHVTVLVRRDQLRASKTMATRLLAHPKVTVRFNTVATEVRGDDKGLMSHLVVKDTASGKEEVVEANGLFYAIGHDPATKLVKGQLNMDEDGYIVTKPGTTLTSIEGVFAAGDVQDKRYRQAITSAGEKCRLSLPSRSFCYTVYANKILFRYRLHGCARGREVLGRPGVKSFSVLEYRIKQKVKPHPGPIPFDRIDGCLEWTGFELDHGTRCSCSRFFVRPNIRPL
jgi:hypothetical protein